MFYSDGSMREISCTSIIITKFTTLHIYIYICVCVCVLYVRIGVCVCVCVCVCTYLPGPYYACLC